MGTESDYQPSLSVALITNGPLAVIVHRTEDPALVQQVTELAARESAAVALDCARAGCSLSAAAAFARSFMLRRSLPARSG